MERIGILGAGRLGSALAARLAARGLPLEGLLVSTGGGEASLARLHALGLGDRIASNEEIARGCGIVLATLRPQDSGLLRALPFEPGALLLSCMAGIPLASVSTGIRARAARAMTSNPDSLAEGKGLAALYPREERAAELLAFLGFETLVLENESLMDAFTASVCLPAALLVGAEDLSEALISLARAYPALSRAFEWAPRVLPEFPSERERAAYLDRMVTPGGITERMVSALRSGLPLTTAFQEGLTRAREIAALAASS